MVLRQGSRRLRTIGARVAAVGVLAAVVTGTTAGFASAAVQSGGAVGGTAVVRASGQAFAGQVAAIEAERDALGDEIFTTSLGSDRDGSKVFGVRKGQVAAATAQQWTAKAAELRDRAERLREQPGLGRAEKSKAQILVATIDLVTDAINDVPVAGR